MYNLIRDIYCRMILTMALANTFITSHNDHLFSCSFTLSFLFKSLIYFKLIFCEWCKIGVQFHSSACGYPIYQHCFSQFSYSVMSDTLRHQNCSMPGFPVYYQLPELAQNHTYWVGDAIQPSHHLSSHSPPAFNLFQHQGFFQGVSSSYQEAKVLKFQLQHQSFQWIFRTDFL